jgi:hypothetical protein
MNTPRTIAKDRWPLLPLAGLAMVLAFCLATKVGPQFEERLIETGEADENPAEYWLGSSSQMFANSMFVKADAYFHSGYYPTIYDNNAPFKTPHLAEDSGAMESKNSGDENTIFMHPNNWVERFQLNFFPSRHTHLDEGGPSGDLAESSQIKEILPWLKISTELDPHRVETFLVTAFWLRNRMHKVNEAESVLRDGLSDNPGDAALLFELGELYREDRKNDPQARNLYLAALNNWGQENKGKADQDKFLIGRILASLAQLEKQDGNTAQALQYLRLLKRVSPTPDSIQKQIDELETNPPTKP